MRSRFRRPAASRSACDPAATAFRRQLVKQRMRARPHRSPQGEPAVQRREPRPHFKPAVRSGVARDASGCRGLGCRHIRHAQSGPTLLSTGNDYRIDVRRWYEPGRNCDWPIISSKARDDTLGKVAVALVELRGNAVGGMVTSRFMGVQCSWRFLFPKTSTPPSAPSRPSVKTSKVLRLQPRVGRPIEDLRDEVREWIIDFGECGCVARCRLDPLDCLRPHALST